MTTIRNIESETVLEKELPPNIDISLPFVIISVDNEEIGIYNITDYQASAITTFAMMLGKNFTKMVIDGVLSELREKGENIPSPKELSGKTVKVELCEIDGMRMPEEYAGRRLN